MSFNVKLQKLGLNKAGSVLWGIDEENVLRLWDLDKVIVKEGKKFRGEKMTFEKNDVWDVKWSADDPSTFCFMEKNKINIVKNFEIQDVVTSNGYLASYVNLEIKSANLEEIMYKPDENQISPSEAVFTYETRGLKDLKEMMKSKVPLKEIYTVVDRLNHTKTWSLLTQHALLNLDFSIAEKVRIFK